MADMKPTVAGGSAPPGPDRTLLTLAGCILVFGLVMVASASISLADKATGNPFYYLERQLMFAMVGVAGAACAYCLPLGLWRRTGFLLLVFAFVLLVLVLVPGIGHHVNGSIRWLALGPFHLQVSEPARLLILMYVAGYIVRRQQELVQGFRGVLKPMLLLGAALLLLLAEPDFGAAIVLIASAMAMLFFGGARLRDFAVFVLLGAIGFVLLTVTSPYRLARLTGFLNPWSDPFDSGFQLTQSLIAIGRGQWFGVGLGESVQKLFYLPEAHTDFLFAVLAEEFGLLGSLLVIGLYLAFTWRVMVIARRAAAGQQMFAACLAFGLGVWIGLQAFINIGVNMGLLPTKGLTLPMMSYGGSSLIVTCTAVGLILRVDRETRTGRSWLDREVAS
ncbi:MAG TPA: putative lipid II flippase FtsW [Gammaproteobacteria bacterium]|nr:putative lipid II flippase FtsW [Gammaproteobacteria bacterium]